MLDYMTTFMTQETEKSKHLEEVLIEQTGTALLNGLGNLLDITSHEARDGNSVDEDSLFVSTPARREKVENTIHEPSSVTIDRYQNKAIKNSVVQARCEHPTFGEMLLLLSYQFPR